MQCNAMTTFTFLWVSWISLSSPAKLAEPEDNIWAQPIWSRFCKAAPHWIRGLLCRMVNLSLSWHIRSDSDTKIFILSQMLLLQASNCSLRRQVSWSSICRPLRPLSGNFFTLTLVCYLYWDLYQTFFLDITRLLRNDHIFQEDPFNCMHEPLNLLWHFLVEGDHLRRRRLHCRGAVCPPREGRRHVR